MIDYEACIKLARTFQVRNKIYNRNESNVLQAEENFFHYFDILSEFCKMTSSKFEIFGASIDDIVLNRIFFFCRIDEWY